MEQTPRRLIQAPQGFPNQQEQFPRPGRSIASEGVEGPMVAVFLNLMKHQGKQLAVSVLGLSSSYLSN